MLVLAPRSRSSRLVCDGLDDLWRQRIQVHDDGGPAPVLSLDGLGHARTMDQSRIGAPRLQ